MDYIGTVGFVAAIVSTINQLPQAWKTIRSKDTHSLSLGMYGMVFIATTLWLVYGILKKDMPLILSNCFSILPISYILWMKIKNTISGKEAKVEKLLKDEKIISDKN